MKGGICHNICNGIMKKMKTLIIIPAYNEALNIEKTIKDVKNFVN